MTMGVVANTKMKPAACGNPALSVRDLKVDFFADGRTIQAVRGISFDLAAGRRLGLVGESGSGKTTTALALMRMIRAPGRITSGSATVAGVDLFALPENLVRKTRLSLVSYIPQGAMNSLNPVYRIEQQFFDAIVDHEGSMPVAELRGRIAEALAGVDLKPDVMRLYPHELSGGMKQRVCIAIGMILAPKLIIADEPTSALDVITQRQVMATLDQVQRSSGAAMILIGHDIGLMAQSVDDLMVMRNGEVEEQGAIQEIFRRPRAAYTRLLINSVPTLDRKEEKTAPASTDGSAVPLLALDNVSKVYGRTFFRAGSTALRPLSLRLPGERATIVSVVGQSGSGKSTLGQLALGLLKPTAGRIFFAGRDLATIPRADQRAFRRDVQAVFQDPYSSFNPFYKVDHGFTVPLTELGITSNREEHRTRMFEACRDVGLDPEAILGRFPHELSGGQRQRLMVARALMLRPKLIIADEPVSMVDASQRASILGNIKTLKDSHGISVIYITHDLATAYQVSDFVIVLQKGRVVEAGAPEAVINAPRHPYTRLLIDSIPWPDPDRPWADRSRLTDDLTALLKSEDSPPVLHDAAGGVKLSVQDT